MRPCPAPGCGKTIAHDWFLCSGHWRRLELAQQINVSAAFRQYKRARDRGGAEEIAETLANLRKVQEIALATLKPATATRTA